MPNRSRLVSFIATADADRARAFYGGTLGLPLVEDGTLSVSQPPGA